MTARLIINRINARISCINGKMFSKALVKDAKDINSFRLLQDASFVSLFPKGKWPQAASLLWGGKRKKMRVALQARQQQQQQKQQKQKKTERTDNRTEPKQNILLRETQARVL